MKENSESLQEKLIKYFKTVLFTVIVLIEPVAFYLKSKLLTNINTLPDNLNFKLIAPLIELPLSIYCNLNVITNLCGMRSLGILEKQMTIFAASLVKISILDPSHANFHMNILESMHSKVLESPITFHDFSKVNFYVLMASKMVHFLEKSHLESKVLVIVNKNLTLLDDPLTPLGSLKSSNRNICHSIWAKIYDLSILHQNTIRFMGKDYVFTLFDKIHNGIDLKLAEDQFIIVLKGLCDFSPAKDHHLFLAADEMDFFSNALSSYNNDSVESIPIPMITMQQKDEWVEAAENFAWCLVLELVRRIEDDSGEISTKTIQNMPLLPKSALSEEIHRLSLSTILFHAIGAISLQRLDELLYIIERILLGNEKQSQSQKKPIGIVRDLDSSLVWGRLFTIVSEPHKIDYSRRAKCVLWYIRVYDKAKKKSMFYSQNGRLVNSTDLVFPIHKAKL